MESIDLAKHLGTAGSASCSFFTSYFILSAFLSGFPTHHFTSPFSLSLYTLTNLANNVIFFPFTQNVVFDTAEQPLYLETIPSLGFQGTVPNLAPTHWQLLILSMWKHPGALAGCVLFSLPEVCVSLQIFIDLNTLTSSPVFRLVCLPTHLTYLLTGNLQS